MEMHPDDQPDYKKSQKTFVAGLKRKYKEFNWETAPKVEPNPQKASAIKKRISPSEKAALRRDARRRSKEDAAFLSQSWTRSFELTDCSEFLCKVQEFPELTVLTEKFKDIIPRVNDELLRLRDKRKLEGKPAVQPDNGQEGPSR